MLNLTWTTALNLFLCLVIVILPSLLMHFITRALPKSWFNKDHKIYRVSQSERDFYLKLGVKKWKDKVPELGKVVNFRKNKLIDPKDPKYIEKFITETRYAEVIHILCAISSLILMWFVPSPYVFTVGVPVGVIYAFLNIPPVIIQRYNRPRLMIQLERINRTRHIEEDEEDEVEDVNELVSH